MTDPPHKRPPRFRRGVAILPSLFTTANLFLGFWAIIRTLHGRFEEAAPLIGWAIVLDLGAINVSHDQVEARLPELSAYKSKDVVVYCRSGRRTGLALDVLKANGFERLWHLEGDMLAWQAQNRPLESSPTPPRPDATPVPDPQ